MGIEQGTSPETRAQAPARRMSRWLAAFALLAFALASVTAGLAALPRAAHAATVTNLALNKTAVADSEEATSVRAANATDGDTTSSTSRWGSNNDATSSKEGGPHWIYVDLGSEQDVAGVRVYWEQRKAKGYKIQVATGTTAPDTNSSDWKDVYTNADRPATKTDAITFTKQKARFVRLYIEKNTYADPDGGTAWGAVSIYELEVFATADGADQQDPSENVALNKTASADSSETNNFGAAKAFDGDTASTASRWASGADATSAKDGGPHWLAVDLGKEQNVKTIRLFWEQRKAKGYKVQIATGDSMPAATDAAWEDVYTHSGNPTTKNETIKLTEAKRARYVRLYIDANQYVDPDGGASWGTVSLFEMEVYGGEPALSMNDLANEIKVTQPAKGDTQLKVELPKSDTYDVTYNGTDYEQVIGSDLTIYQPVVDTTVKASFKVAKKSDPTNYVFREINVTVPGAYTKATGDNAAPAVLPELREWKGESGNFQITDASRVLYGDAEFKAAAEELAADYKDLFGRELTVASGATASAGDIVLAKADNTTPGLGDEGYYMTIADGITVKASANAGAYWSTRTILQALKLSGNGTIAKGITRDYPLYQVRGLILDVGRKTFTLDFLKQMVKQLSWYKLNDFQVHLNDNYIWVEEYNENKAGMDADSWKLPYSGFRLESDIKKGGNDGKNQADLTSTDVWYSKADFRSFIKDSRDLGVNIVPEFDMPAHSLALTKVRPDLRTPTSMTHRGNDHLNIATKYDDSLAFALSIWDEYLKGDDPVFDEQTVVHIGADEFEADGTAYRKFVKDLFEHVESTGRTARVWGSLDRIKGNVDVTGKASADGLRRQMNIWSTGWAKFDTMYKAGFDLINCIDSTYYIVPNAGYYADYLNQNTMYNGNINTLGGVTIPAGDQQMIGGAFAVWNDMCFARENGISEYDVYDRITKAASMYTASVWGRGSMTVEQAKASAATLGDAPQTNFGYEAKKTTDGTVAQYKMNDAKDASGNAADLQLADGATIADVDGTKALKLDGKTANATTGLGTVGLGNDLRVKVKRTSSSTDEQILFESDYGQIKAVQAKTGQVGITRENHDYSFNYTLPVNEWVELEFKNVQNKTSLYVDGELVETIGLDGGNKLKATCMFPVERIGSKTAAFQGYADDLRISTAKDYASTIEVDRLLVIARAVLQNTESAELKALVEQGQGLVEQMDPSADEITSLADNIKKALSGLEYERADYAAVDALIAAVNDLDLSAYKDDDVAQLRAAISAVTRDLPVAMQADVDASYQGIQEAIAGLEKKTDEDRYATGMTATACSEETTSENSPASNAVDGNEATIWHTRYSGSGDTDADHWLNVKLEKPLTVDAFVYVPRSGAVNGRLNKYRIEVSTDGGSTYTEVASGTVSDNSKTSTFTFNAVANVTDVKLVFVGKGQGGFASAAEVKVHYAETPATKTELDAAIKKTDGLNEGNYTDASWATFNEALENARAVSGKTDATAAEIDGALSALVSAQLGLKVSEAIQPAGKGSIEVKGTSVRYPAKNEDVATSLAGLRFGYTFTLPAGAMLVEDQTGWYYGTSEDAVKNAVEKQDTTHFAKALNRKAVDGNANAFVSNIVFTQIPSANYRSKLFAQAQLAYKLKDSDVVVTVTGEIRSDSAVDWAGRVPSDAGEARTLADAILAAAPKADTAK